VEPCKLATVKGLKRNGGGAATLILNNKDNKDSYTPLDDWKINAIKPLRELPVIQNENPIESYHSSPKLGKAVKDIWKDATNNEKASIFKKLLQIGIISNYKFSAQLQPFIDEYCQGNILVEIEKDKIFFSENDSIDETSLIWEDFVMDEKQKKAEEQKKHLKNLQIVLIFMELYKIAVDRNLKFKKGVK